MSLKFEFENERKKVLGLTENNTKKIYDTFMNYYKELLINAPRNIIGYSIDIVLCNMNLYNRLGKLEEINEKWGDSNLYVDINNSSFVELHVEKNGDIESGFDDIQLKDIPNINEIEKISLSLKEIIELCKKDNLNIKIFAKDSFDYETTIEIEPYKPFEMSKDLKTYLDSVK